MHARWQAIARASNAQLHDLTRTMTTSEVRGLADARRGRPAACAWVLCVVAGARAGLRPLRARHARGARRSGARAPRGARRRQLRPVLRNGAADCAGRRQWEQSGGGGLVHLQQYLQQPRRYALDCPTLRGWCGAGGWRRPSLPRCGRWRTRHRMTKHGCCRSGRRRSTEAPAVRCSGECCAHACARALGHGPARARAGVGGPCARGCAGDRGGSGRVHPRRGRGARRGGGGGLAGGAPGPGGEAQAGR
eukprot:scaffold26943_cov33-Phaeocystis_antarctica.AAC.1